MSNFPNPGHVTLIAPAALHVFYETTYRQREREKETETQREREKDRAIACFPCNNIQGERRGKETGTER